MSICELFPCSFLVYNIQLHRLYFLRQLQALIPQLSGIAVLCWTPPPCIVIWKFSLGQKFRAIMGLLMAPHSSTLAWKNPMD